jgi:hypothetical protein
MQPLDMRSDRTHIDALFVDPDIAVLMDRNQDGHCRLLNGSQCIWARNIYASLLDERGGHDEKNQHDEHDIKHGRQVDVGLVVTT